MSTSSAQAAAPPRLTLPVSQWPEIDRHLWHVGQQPAAPFRSKNVASTWSDARRHIVEDAYGQWLAWLKKTNSLDTGLQPAARVTVERIDAYVEQLRSRVAPVSVAMMVGALQRILHALQPEIDLTWLRAVYQHLKVTAKPSRDKRGTVVPIKDLYDLGVAAMEAADGASGRSDYIATAYRDGQIVALLGATYLRMRNLSSIEIGRHLLYRDGSYWLKFTEEETKNGTAIDIPLPQDLVPYLERYLSHHRNVLLGFRVDKKIPPTRALWVNRWGFKMDSSAIRAQIEARTRKAFNRKIWPHLFRDCFATSAAIEDPENLPLAADLLGHQLRTLQRYYNQVRTLEAGRVYQRRMRELRREAKRTTRMDKHPDAIAHRDDGSAF